MEDVLHILAEHIALGVNLLGMLAITIGAIQGAIGLTRLLLFHADEEKLGPVWLALGRWLVAGLTFQLAADIVETTIAPSWDDIGKLAAIAALRTMLNFFLDRDMEGLRERIWWGSGSNATAVWAAKLGMNLQSSTLKDHESDDPFHVQQADQIRAYRAAWKEAGHTREPRVSVSRSIFALVDDRDRAYFGRGGESEDQIGHIDENTRSIFGRSYAAEPENLVKELANDEAIAEADTLMLTVPNQLGVDYNAHVIESILTHVAPELGWR